MRPRLTRRCVLGAAVATGTGRGLRPQAVRSTQADEAATSPTSARYPIGSPDQVPGDGFIIRHGYACENTWYNPGWLHAGEDWYATEGDTAGALVYAVSDGEVVFAGSEYPGLVVIVQHADALFSMYGHLDYALGVAVGDRVQRGDVLGTVLARSDGRAPSHLHFEIRTFLTSSEVNGDAPRYGVGCGYRCPPGPGYWPIDAPEHPSDIGWRNPTHAIARASSIDGKPPTDIEVTVSTSAGGSTRLWSAPEDTSGASNIGILELEAGDRYRLLAIDAGRGASRARSADAYRLWYEIAVADSERAWVRAAVPSAIETGSDGRPSAVRLDFLPVAPVAE